MTEFPTGPQRDAEIDRAFAAALDLEGAEQRAHLNELRARNADLADAVERLLAAADRPDPRLDPEHWIGRRLRAELGWPPAGFGHADPHTAEADPASDAADDREGDRVGPYRVVEEIGRGGMSVVYRAERADGLFDQTVALKFLGVPHDVGVRRFEQERQILAGLNHAHIARLLDGGTDERGRPYIAMEYVEGRPLDEYCRETGADLRRTLELIGVVATAVEYAHRNLVVHRDIKPSNILVTDDGQVKLLDFGIAKLLTPGDAVESGAAVPVTRTMVRVLTPEYASPEQVLGQRITTASDVYQLGVVLYELLSGRRPFDLDHATASEIERAICHEDPPPPSTAATRPGAAGPERHDPVALRRRLRGDLDTIVMKALAKEPERRYASVGELREDLLRHQQGLPVRARPQTTVYRAAKFVRRHRAGVATTAMLAVLLATYAFTVTVQSRRIAAEAARTERVSEILASLFTAANPGVSQGAEPTAADLLEAGALRVADELADQPDIQAQIMALLGEVYGTLGRYDEAAALLGPALAVRRRLLRPSDPQLAHTVNQLGQIRHFQGRLAEADTLLREALQIRRRAFGERSWQVGQTLDELGDLLHTRGELVDAEAVLRRALAIQLAAGGDVTTVKRHLANVRRDRGSVVDAEELYRESLRAAEERHGMMDPIAALTRSELAKLLAETGRHQDAETLLEHNLAVYATLYPRGHPMVGTTLRNLGVLRLRQARPAAARDLFDQSLAAYERTLPVESSLVQRTRRYLAEAMLELGEVDAAAELAADIADRLRGLGIVRHPALADVLEIRALALLRQHRNEEAEELLSESLVLRERLSIESDPRLEATRRYHAAAVAASTRPAATESTRPETVP